MKPIKLKTITYVLMSVIIFTSCSEAPKGDKAVITEKKESADLAGVTYVVDTADYSIRFTGHGVGKNHPGRFKVSSGNVTVANNQITGGNFVIDVKSMDLDQKEPMFRDKLHPHLLSGDFLDVEKFDKATFDITSVSPYDRTDNDTSIVEGANFTIGGNLKIKDVTKNISFPAHVDLDGNTLKAKANFDIDRTQWQINYGNDKTLGDKFISEKVNIELDLKAHANQSQANM
jgi:polyisoprenoid-binding protein YceI